MVLRKILPERVRQTWYGNRSFVCADDYAFGDLLVGRQNLFHRSGGEPVARHVDDVIRAARDEDIAAFVPVAGIRCEIIARN